nr:DUF3127 domain-containing protein [uncultured Flavobacterium sp.]
MEISGIIKLIRPTEQPSEKFIKRELILTTDASTPYPQHISLLAVNKNTSMLNAFTEGQEVVCSVNLKGKEYNGKYYNTLEIWKITLIN